MTLSEILDWRVPHLEWEKFVEFVDSEKVANDRYIRQFVESAMEEWIDADGGNATEEKLNQVIKAAG